MLLHLRCRHLHGCSCGCGHEADRREWLVSLAPGHSHSNKARTLLFPNPKSGSLPLPYTFAKQVQQLLGDPQRCVRGPGRCRVDKAHFFHVFVI